MSLALGTRLGRYEIRSQLGAGGMGEVYLAEDTKLGRKVAIKILPNHSFAGEQANKRLLREAKAAATLDHPNICTVHEAGEEEGRSFIVMQYVEGETLDVLMRRKRLSLSESLSIACEVAEALAEAHAHGIIHRDIKPSNIIITARGQAKVMDFGLAKVLATAAESEAETQSLLTTPGAIVGTMPYMSPEQIRGEQVDPRSDIFSLGVVLYEMLSGKRAFMRDTPTETIAAILKDDLPRLAATGIQVPHELDELMQHCLQKDPNQRLSSAHDLAVSLSSMATNERASKYIDGPTTRRLYSLIWIGVALLLTILALGWWRPWQRKAIGQLHQRLISSFRGGHREASFSPDGSMIAFVNDAGGVSQIWVKNLTEGDPIQITTGENPANHPSWSPTNDQIVFSRADGIWSVGTLGGPSHQVIEGGHNPNWSWDGNRLVFEKDDEIWTANADGTDQRKVEGVPRADILLADRKPAFSPDGSLIAFFQCSKGPIGDIWVIPAVGGQPRQLTFDDHFGGDPSWTPDGRFIVFSSLRAGSLTLWKIAVSDGEPEPVLQSAGEDTEANISRDGTKLIYTNTRNSFILTLWNPATNQTRELMDSRYDITDPSFSPKSDRIAFFLVENNGDIQIHTIDLSGGNSIQVTKNKGERNIHPRWSPDGSWLYHYQILPTISFRKISINGGLSSEIAAGWAWGTHNQAQVDPQGKLIAYVRQEKDRPPVTMIREIETGKETVLKSSLSQPQWSKDGKSIVGSQLVAGDSNTIRQISICSVETTTCRQLAQGRLPRWSGDGSRVYFLRDRIGDGKELWSISSAGGDEKLIGVLLSHPIGYSYDVSPTGEIVYVRFNPGKPELWLADLPHP